MHPEKIISAALLKYWDPIGVKSNPNAKGEYDQCALAIYGMLHRGTDRREIVQFLGQFAKNEFGLIVPEMRSEEAAQKILALDIKAVAKR